MKMETELCVVTLNCWGIKLVSKDRVPRMTAIADELASGKYDFVFLQEVWTTEDYERIKRRARDVLPYSHYFYSGVIGAGICIFSKSEIKSAFFHQWAVNGYIHKIQHGDWFGGKGIGMVEVVHRGLKVNLYTTHLHAEYDRVNDEYLAHRVIQAFDTAQFIKMTSKNADIVILGGDLNTEPGDLAYKVIVHTAELTDAINDLDKLPESINTNDTAGNSYTSPMLLRANPNGKRIDYICYKTGESLTAKALSCETPWPTRVSGASFSYSDHEAVVAKLKISKSTSVETTPLPEDEKIEALLEGVKICTTALDSLEFSKKGYALLSLLCFILLYTCGSMELPGILYLLPPVTRLLIWVVFFFSTIMGTVWNRMEVNGILAGKLTMELESGTKSSDSDSEDYETLAAGGDAHNWTDVKPDDCSPP